MRGMLMLCVLAAGCSKKRVEAPDAMEENARFIFRNYDTDDELVAGIEQLITWLGPNLGTEQAELGYSLTRLDTEDTANIDHPNGDQTALLGAAVLAVSPYTLEQHAETMVLDDQRFANPNRYNNYERTVPAEQTTFLDGSGRLDTSNEIETQTVGVRIPYTLIKSYRWLESDYRGNSVRVDGEEVETFRAIVARSHIPASGCNAGGDNCLIQSFSDDIWIQVNDSPDTLRFTATWNEVQSPATAFFTEQQQINLLAAGMVDVFVYTDEFISEGGVD